MKNDVVCCTGGGWSDDVGDTNGEAGEYDDEANPSDELSDDGEVEKMQQPQPTYKPIHAQQQLSTGALEVWSFRLLLRTPPSSSSPPLSSSSSSSLSSSSSSSS